MTPPRALVVSVLAAALAPSVAAAEDVRLVVRDEPIGRAQAVAARAAPLRARPAPLHFNLVGLHWVGPGAVWFRTAPRRGAWSAWRSARPEAEDLPDRGSPEAGPRVGWKLGNPYWTGTSRLIQYRLRGRVSRLRAHFLWSEVAGRPRSLARAQQPAIIPRAFWGANESIVRAPPTYAESVRFAIVHHTAGANSYTAAQSAAIVRGIQTYHVRGNGWNDIGYNFLVDKYGQVFEGRAGGIDQNVVGAHAQGFNTGSTGVAVLGTYQDSEVSPTARAALEELLAWRLDVAHVDPLAQLTWVSAGNPRYAAGTPVALRAVSGHRDTGSTTCPGTALYGQLPGIAATAAARGLPKLYDAGMLGGLGGPVRFTARLSAPLSWTVSVADAGGNEVARGSGSGTLVDWTWDATGLPVGSFTYAIDAGPEVLPATGPVRGPPPLAVANLVASPRAVTPNGDGVGDTMRISFALSVSASVTVSVLDPSDAVVTTLVAGKTFPPGLGSVDWDGTGPGGVAVPDGRYRVHVSAQTGVEQATALGEVVVDRTLGAFEVRPSAFSPNGDRRRDLTRLGFELTRNAVVRVRILDGRRRVATLASRTLEGTGRQTIAWKGSGSAGRVRDGAYTVVVSATSALGTRKLTRPVTVDTWRPRVHLRSARRVGGFTRLRLALSEPALLRIWYTKTRRAGGGFVAVRRSAGVTRIRLATRVGQVRIVAHDAAGNRSRRIRIKVR